MKNIFFAIILGIVCFKVSGANYFWTGAISNAWSDVGNWNTGTGATPAS